MLDAARVMQIENKLDALAQMELARGTPWSRHNEAIMKWNEWATRSVAGGLCGALALAGFAAAASQPGPEANTPPSFEFPQQREVDGLTLVLHAPQIRAWPDFEHFEALVAVEVSSPDDQATHYGTASLSGGTEIDLASRLVRVRSPRVDSVTFTEPVPDSHRDAVMHAASRSELDVPVDLFLAYLADDVLSEPPPPGFNSDPPPILVRSKPTMLLSINGEPVKADIPGTWLQQVVNANWPLFRATGEKGAYYLLERDRWLTSSKLEKGWKAAKSLPPDFSKLPDEPEYAAARAALPFAMSSRPVPKVLYAETPTELIVTDGKPAFEAIEGAEGLELVVNTDSPLFRIDGAWYYLVAGRWFRTSKLEKGPWTYVEELPHAFSLIPTDHRRAAEVRASVPGTVEARMAALEALLPTKVAAARNDLPPVEVTYAAEPSFEPVPGTPVSRAANTGFDIIEFQGLYYLLYAGIWYEASAPTGPWAVTASVPSVIYQIPPSSPSYHVTQVKVIESTPTNVVYSYPPSYSSSVYVVYGVPYYGTGWHYPPYISGRYYYPYPVAYGYGSWYNPATGGYGSRSAWYGPYGGYTYNQGYNPSTGRYGAVETAWDGDEWASYGETYNPRTGVGTETSRYYDEDRDTSEMERTTRRGDEWVNTEREVDYDDRTSQTERKTSQGGSSTVRREASEGTVTSDGTIQAGDGRSYTIAGEATRGGGSTTITGGESSATIDTSRQDGRSISSIEGSQGGQGMSVSGQGQGRTTIGQSDSGDLYAGRDGNVYKKTDGGWQHFQGGGWQQVDVAERPRDPASRQSWRSQASAGGSGTMNLDGMRSRQGSASRDFSQLDRDFGARQQGSRQFQRRSGSLRGMGGRGGGGRRR